MTTGPFQKAGLAKFVVIQDYLLSLFRHNEIVAGLPATVLIKEKI